MLRRFSAVVKTRINGSNSHSLIDSGAGKSLIDLGTYEHLKLLKTVITPLSPNEQLTDASDNEMDILGKASVRVEVLGSGKELLHEFHVLNKRTYKNVILGLDFMARFKEVTFDFQNNDLVIDGRKIIKAP